MSSTHCKEGNVQNREVKGHAQTNSCNEVRVLPDWEYEQTLICRQGIRGVEHFNGNEDRKTHGRRSLGHFVGKHGAANLREQRRALVEVSLPEG